MLRSLYTAATGMDAQQTKLDVIATTWPTRAPPASRKRAPIFRISCQKPFAQPRSPMRRGAASPRRCRWVWACARLHIALLRPGRYDSRPKPRSIWPSRAVASSASSAPTATSPSPAMAVSDWMPPDALSPVGRSAGAGITIPTDATNVTGDLGRHRAGQTFQSYRHDQHRHHPDCHIRQSGWHGSHRQQLASRHSFQWRSIVVKAGDQGPEVSRKATWKARTCPRSRK